MLGLTTAIHEGLRPDTAKASHIRRPGDNTTDKVGVGVAPGPRPRRVTRATPRGGNAVAPWVAGSSRAVARCGRDQSPL
jgi:hypothetical protein